MKKIFLALVFTSFLFNANAFAETEKTEEISLETYKLLNLFGDVFERVRKDYVDEVTDKKLVEQALNGMLSSLDPHSGYLDADGFKDMQTQTSGQFGGLGIEVTLENGWVKVVSPMDDTPAYKAGLQPGDFITHLNGENVMGMTLMDAVKIMRGKPKTKIKLTIRRGTKSPFDVTLVRDIIRLKSVKYEIERNNLGYIRITSFNESTEKNVKEAVAKIQEKVGKDLKGYVIDLRNNPGGLLDQAISVSDLFLNKGEIVSTRARNEKDTQRFNAVDGDIANGLPIVVLINEGSASAAEIVSGALQDHKRAVLVGVTTFGKGSVQTIIPIPDHGAIRLTTARYYTPSGRSIQAKGIVPDIEIKQAEIKLVETYSYGESELHNALVNEQSSEKADSKKEEKEEKSDYQLERALDILQGLVIYSESKADL
ncbi:MAG: S41 family peptidase [Alphaproteobacteria bacterium]